MPNLVIWNIILEGREHKAELPTGATVIAARDQNNRICVWVKCDPTAPKEQRTFCIVPTGQHFEDDGRAYIGTAHLDGGTFVFHVFETFTKPETINPET